MKFDRCLLPTAFAIAIVGVTAGAWAQADPAIVYVADYYSKGQNHRDLMVANADGTNRTAVLSRTSRYSSGMELLAFPAWSPDLDSNASNGFQGTIAATFRDVTRGAWILFLVDVTVVGGTARGANYRELVASDLDPVTPGYISSPKWSPDVDPLSTGYQGKIAFQGVDSVSGGSSVCTIDMVWDGLTARPVNGPNSATTLWVPWDGGQGPRYPTWSPDGTWMAVVHGTELLTLFASTGDVLGSVPGWLPGDSLDWERAGNRIVYREGGNRLRTIDTQTSDTELVTSASSSILSPSWSPDGLYIVFQAFAASSRERNTIRRVEVATGVTVTLITDSKQNLWYPDWRRF